MLGVFCGVVFAVFKMALIFFALSAVFLLGISQLETIWKK